MLVSNCTADAGRSRRSDHFLVRAAVAAILGGTAFTPVNGAEADGEESELQEITVTGSRIVRRDEESTSPLITVGKEVLEKSSYVSLEQALNELPEFMAGGALMGAAAVTSLTEAGNVAGGSGSGNMFDTARGVDNARMGTFTPGQATVNLRGLGPNRSLTLIDGRRGIAANASGTLDLNSVPQIALSNIEVITGGASAVYGADALAGVTNLKLRNNFEGVEIRARGGLNEYGSDGGEYQISTLLGTSVAGKGHAMIAMDYTNREIALWANRPWFRDAMESNQSGSGNYLFALQPSYTAGPTGIVNGNGGSNTVFNNAWSGNAPSQAAINQIFGQCTLNGANVNCLTPTNNGGGFYFNADGTLFTRSSSLTQGGVNYQFGPQSFTGTLGGTKEHPDEVTCAYASGNDNRYPGLQRSCAPLLGTVDYGRRLTSPREAFTLFGSADYNISERITAYSTISFANSHTETRREPAPASGNWTVAVPYHSDPTARYLPSIATVAAPGVAIGDTLPEYRAGGSRGLSCPTNGGCTMQQAFPVSPELATLLNSRPSPNLTSGAFSGLTACELHITPTTSVMDPNTGQTLKTCGPNSAWRLATQLTFLPPRGTINDLTSYQLVTGFKGDTGISDWTWDLYASHGESRTNTQYEGYISTANYAAIVSAPNYGRGYSAQSNGVSNKRLSCTSGINPWLQAAGTLQVSQDCIDAVTSNQTDRESMEQFEGVLNLQGGLFELPAGEVRSAVGLSYRKNDYSFTPDSLRESDYIYDTTPGQFGVGHVDGAVTAKEVYAELLIPLLKNLPLAHSVELELGFRHSKYSTGQKVPTYKAQLSWAPLDWLRFRGGYNRAERTPNIAELFTTTTVSSQLSGVGNDPCRNNVTNALPTQSNTPNNPNRTQLLALCSAQINAWGGNNASTFHADPLAFNSAGGVLTFQANPNLKSEKGDTWTAGMVFQSPFDHALARRITATVDWYSVDIKNPIDVVSGQLVMDACFNVNGTNPSYQLDDPTGYCQLIERDPSSGGVRTVNAIYDNIGRLGVEGIDTNVRWSADLADMGMANMPGSLTVSFGANVLTKQQQPVSVGGQVLNYAGYLGSAKLRTNTTFGYNWNDSRISLNWLFRTQTHGVVNNRPSPLVAGYKPGHLFNLSGGTRIGDTLDVGLNISNLLNTKPTRGGYFYADETQGFGTFNPYGDLVGRRYSVSLTASF